VPKLHPARKIYIGSFGKGFMEARAGLLPGGDLSDTPKGVLQ
jgi:hypothetical protein